MDTDLALQFCVTLINNWFAHPQYKHLYQEGIRQHMATIEEEFSTYQSHLFVYRQILRALRTNALNSRGEAFLEDPNLYSVLTLLKNTDILVQDAMKIHNLEKQLKACWDHDIDGELTYVIEEMFYKNLFKALRKRHAEYLAEKKRRFNLIAEDLIATACHPERIQRFAAAAGMEFIDYIEQTC
jgi:hypothetical protein